MITDKGVRMGIINNKIECMNITPNYKLTTRGLARKLGDV